MTGLTILNDMLRLHAEDIHVLPHPTPDTIRAHGGRPRESVPPTGELTALDLQSIQDASKGHGIRAAELRAIFPDAFIFGLDAGPDRVGVQRLKPEVKEQMKRYRENNPDWFLK